MEAHCRRWERRLPLRFVISRCVCRRSMAPAPAPATTTTLGIVAVFCLSRSFAFSSAEEAAAERRRMKRRLRIEPPLQALRRESDAPRPPRDPYAARLPDSTSSLVGPRLNLHNRVQSLIRSSQLDAASSTARQAVFSPPRPTVFTCNAVMAAMLRASRLDDTVALFHYFFKQSNIIPNIVSYNILINTHCDAGVVDTALDVYHHILEHAPFTPSHVTYRHLTKGLVDSNRISEAMDLLREMLNKGHGADSLVYNNLIRGFLNLGNVEKAMELFEELRERCVVYDGVVHATLMEAYFQKGMVREAMGSYKQLLDRQFNMNVITCNTLLEVLLKYGRMRDALDLFDHMLVSHKPPHFTSVNTDSYTMMVNSHFQAKRFVDAIEILKKTGPKPCVLDVDCYNNVIRQLCEEDGWAEEAEKLFDEMIMKSVQPDKVTCELLVHGYCRQRKVDDVLRLWGKMVDRSIPGVDVTFHNKIIGEMVRNDELELAQEVLTGMLQREVKPDILSYEPIITAFCKQGRLEKIQYLLKDMEKNEVALTTMLHDIISRTFGEESYKDIQRSFSEEGVVDMTDSSVAEPHSVLVTA